MSDTALPIVFADDTNFVLSQGTLVPSSEKPIILYHVLKMVQNRQTFSKYKRNLIL